MTTALVNTEPHPHGMHESYVRTLEAATEHALSNYLAAQYIEQETAPLGLAARLRLRLAADSVAAAGVPYRHTAARQSVTGYIGVFDSCFHPGPFWRTAPSLFRIVPGMPVWEHADGRRVVDIVRAHQPSHPVWNTQVQDRCISILRTCRARHVGLAGVRVLAMTAPMRSMFVDASGQLHTLASTDFAASLTARVTS